MARLSKTHNFKVYEDTGIPTPPTDENDPFDYAVTSSRANASQCTTNNDEEPTQSAYCPPADIDNEALPRESFTSVSSFPESTSQHNDDEYTPLSDLPQKTFTPHIIRPSFRRPESVRRMQMNSPRQSILSYYQSSRSGTPQSANGGSGPRGRRRITEESTSEEEEQYEPKGLHPLVLLHVTLLPIPLPWSEKSMQELLPPQVLENVELLKSKISATVLQRGVLIRHPREEYEILEELLLEALELKEPTLTKCGHFRGRTSSTSQDSNRGSDSGLGSDDSEDGEVCTTCQHHIRSSPGRKQKWSIKVFAANGLMRWSAWAAAWSEMESVDIEILPWISEEDRRKLDRRRVEEVEEEQLRGSNERTLVPEAREEEHWAREETRIQNTPEVKEYIPTGHDCSNPRLELHSKKTSFSQFSEDVPDTSTTHDLPKIYRPSQIPLSVLLKNYIFLLAQNRRNVVMCFFGMLALLLAMRSTAPPGHKNVLPISTEMVQPITDAFMALGESERTSSVAPRAEDVPDPSEKMDEDHDLGLQPQLLSSIDAQ